MNQRTVDYEPTTGGWKPVVPGTTEVVVLSTSDQTGLKEQFPRGPINGKVGVGAGATMTRDSVKEDFRDLVMMGPVPKSEGYWGFDTEVKLDFTGPTSLNSPPQYGIVGDGGGDPLNSFMPNLTATPLPLDPLAQPKGWDSSNLTLLRVSGWLVGNGGRRGRPPGSGPGTLLSPWQAVDALNHVSAWRKPLNVTGPIEIIGKYEMGSSGMTGYSLEFENLENPPES